MSARSLRIAFVVTLAVLAGISVFLLVTVQNWRKVGDKVTHSYEVMNEVRTLLNTTLEAESGQRGYLITSQEEFLQPYYTARKSTDSSLARLSRLVSDNPLQTQRVDEIASQVGKKLAWLDSLVIAQKDRTPEDASFMEVSTEGLELMARVRAIGDRMLVTEDSLLDLRGKEADRRSTVVVVLFAISTLLAAGLVFGLYRMVRRDQETREVASRSLKMNNERLEARVAERTAEIAATNDALVRSNHELKRSNRELQEFAYVASHDLQEPLRKIRTFADLMREEYSDKVDEEGQHYLTRMQQAASRMSRLISDLLTFSRVATKARAFETVVLDDVMREVIDDLEMAVREHGAEVQVGPLPRIEADGPQMRQLFQNLVGNALKFRRDGVTPLIRIRAVPADDEANVAIEVEDNGIGFDEKYRDRIFVPFQRLHTRGEYDGTGIGLAVVRRIVERHEGAISAQSREGVGTTFTVTLPRHHDAPLVAGPDALGEVEEVPAAG